MAGLCGMCFTSGRSTDAKERLVSYLPVSPLKGLPGTAKPRYNEPRFSEIPAIARWPRYLN